MRFLHVNPMEQPNGEVWQPPPPMEYKLNFDAVIFLGMEKFGISAIIRNEKGEVMAGMFAIGTKVDTSEEVEVLRVEDPLNLLWMLVSLD